MKSLTTLLQPDFSEVGSNKRKFENQVYSAFLKYLRSVASKNLIVNFYYFKQKMQKQCSKIVFVCNLSIHVPKMNDKCIDFHLGGHRSGISLNNILQFATCDEEVPLLGYENGVKPSATFHEVAENKSFIPTANTCCCRLLLPTPSLEIALPDEETLFQLYDMAFLNAYFGRK